MERGIRQSEEMVAKTVKARARAKRGALFNFIHNAVAETTGARRREIAKLIQL
jgi:hypothetical protein